jgi:CheY-like chemotaxis protein
MGGGIDVTSELGVGSKFTAYIDPSHKENEPLAILQFDADLSYKPRENDKQLQGRVLVVDDLSDIRRLVGHIVEGFGVDVEYAVNGLMAVESVARSIASGAEFDLVLMDLHMPEMDGTTAAKEMRKRNFSMPLVALTAASMRGSLEKLKSAGFDNLLSKPVDTEKLYEMLSQYLSLAAVASADKLSSSMIPADTARLTMLIVEDDDDAASALQSLLAVLGVDAHIACNIGEAQSQIAQGAWSAILLDKNLPDGDGLSLIPKINEIATKPYIVLISGESLDSVNMQGLGLDCVLLKPIQMSSLKKLIDDVRLIHVDC